MELRGYGSPIQPTNIGNEIPDEAVEHLMAVTEANYGMARSISAQGRDARHGQDPQHRRLCAGG